MKKLLDWKHKDIVNIYDEVNLWSAPFGRLLLEHIPMKQEATVVDIGFGTGFPLIELSQRFGEHSTIYGIDLWEEAIRRTKEKINQLEIDNIEIIEENAAKISLDDHIADLIVSNLGVNNFEEKEAVYSEIYRVLKKGGHFALTTNPKGTFQELFDVFHALFEMMGLKEEQDQLANYIEHRSTEASIIGEVERHGLKLMKRESDTTRLRFVDAEAILNHALIRIGFRAYWENMISLENRVQVFKQLTATINDIIVQKGEFTLTIPMLYLEFKKD